MFLRILILLSFTVLIGHSQNLVPNPSFEDYSDCPDAEGQIEFAEGWFNAGGTPDYFNLCATFHDFSVPLNWAGFQNASTGYAYCALGTYGTEPSNNREYVGAKLHYPLTVGNTYFMEFKANYGYSESLLTTGMSNNLGVLFSTKEYDRWDPVPIVNYAHLNFPNILTDTAGWTTIKGSFVADSAYEYVYLGNFFDDTLTNIQALTNDTGWTTNYFLDDVYVSTFPSSISKNKNNELTILQTPEGIKVSSDNEIIQITIFDQLGRLIFTTNNPIKVLPVKFVSSGIYFCKVFFKDSIELTSQIIIAK